MYAVYVDADPSTVREIQLTNTVIESGSMSFTLMEILGNLPTRPRGEEINRVDFSVENVA